MSLYSVTKWSKKNQHLLKVVCACHFGAHMPRSFFGETVCSAAYLINLVPSGVLQFQTPLQTVTHHCKLPSTSKSAPCVFGCVVFVHVPKSNRVNWIHVLWSVFFLDMLNIKKGGINHWCSPTVEFASSLLPASEH